MAYIGKTPTVGNFQKCDAISVVNGQAGYTLQVDGSNVSPESANHCLVSLNGILQAPTDSYTISGSTITFASNLATGDVIDFVIILGNVLDLGVPSDNTVSLAKLTATGTKDATTFLRGDNSFSTISAGIEQADIYRLTANVTGDTDITANLERSDDASSGLIGSGMTESSGIFTFPSTGIYLIMVQANFSYNNQADNSANLNIYVTINNSTYDHVASAVSGNGNQTGATAVTSFSQAIVDVTDTSNVKVKFNTSSLGGTLQGSSVYNATSFSFIRLGDT